MLDLLVYTISIASWLAVIEPSTVKLLRDIRFTEITDIVSYCNIVKLNIYRDGSPCLSLWWCHGGVVVARPVCPSSTCCILQPSWVFLQAKKPPPKRTSIIAGVRSPLPALGLRDLMGIGHVTRCERGGERVVLIYMFYMFY